MWPYLSHRKTLEQQLNLLRMSKGRKRETRPFIYLPEPTITLAIVLAAASSR